MDNRIDIGGPDLATYDGHSIRGSTSLDQHESARAGCRSSGGQGHGSLWTGLAEGDQQEHHAGHDQQATVAILDVGWVNHCVHQQARGVDQNMPLLATDFLPRVIPFGIDAGPSFSALFTL